MTRYLSHGRARVGRVCVATALATALSAGAPQAMAPANAAGTKMAASCAGPAGAAYVAEAGYQAFGAIDTATCELIGSYNVDDLPVPGDSSDVSYIGTDVGLAMRSGTLWFAVTGTSNVAAISASSLNPKTYSPTEQLVPVGLFPDELAIAPNGAQVWVADTGPQTSGSPVYGLSVINTKTYKVVASMPLTASPTDVVFAPSGRRVYVTTSAGLSVYSVTTHQLLNQVAGLGDPRSVAVSRGGSQLYVTETADNKLATLNSTTLTLIRTTTVGDTPWQAVVSSNGSDVYVANPGSNTISVVGASSGAVAHTFSVSGAPDTLALSPGGSQLWVGEADSGIAAVLDPSSGASLAQVNLGGEGPQSGDGLDPTGIVLTSSPTPGS